MRCAAPKKGSERNLGASPEGRLDFRGSLVGRSTVKRETSVQPVRAHPRQGRSEETLLHSASHVPCELVA